MTAMGPLMEYFHTHPGVGPKESMFRVTQEKRPEHGPGE